jgi:hypothetical protein
MSRVAVNEYPVAVPFRPPQQTADPAARLRQWTFGLLAAAALLLLVTVAGGVFWANRLTASGETAPPAAADAPAPSVAAQPAPVASISERVRADKLLSALGGLSIAHLFQTYFNIGLLEDGVENEAYTKAEAEKTLAKVLLLMDQVDGHLSKLKGAGLDASDQKAVDRICAASAWLRAQAEALRAYWRSGEKEQAQRYQAAREQALTALTELEAKE